MEQTNQDVISAEALQAEHDMAGAGEALRRQNQSNAFEEEDQAGGYSEHSFAEEDREGLMEMYLDKEMNSLNVGEVVKGRIVKIDKEYVLVDVGYKSEGHIATREFLDREGNVMVKVGDTVDVLVERYDQERDVFSLSKEKAARMRVWDEIKKAYTDNTTIFGVVSSRVKGGFSVDIGVQSFLPGSQADIRPIRDFNDLVGKTFEFKVLKYSRKQGNIVLSRRAFLEEHRAQQRKDTLSEIHEGKVVKGIIKNITEYGAFVDLGGIDGLLHITDMSWGRIVHPSEILKIGEEVDVKVIGLDLERERVSLSIKELMSDPWATVIDRYPVGTRIQGKVISVVDYGAFVELEKGVEGLIHVSEMSWTQKIKHPSKAVSVGDLVDVVVLNIEVENRKISLGMKQLAPNPWDVISEKYPIGTVIEGKVKNITDFGVFVGIEDGIDGLIHISDLSWTKRVKHPSELFHKGDVVRAVVMNIDKEQQRFSLGMKQLQADPWDTILERYQVGTKINGRVTNITDFGIFLELEEGIEGLIHISEITKDKEEKLVGKFNVGDVLSAKVVNVSSAERRIGLSIKK
ncbi:MAG: 30S ribosomal protein S1, partial [Pseudomonadota bacterium]